MKPPGYGSVQLLRGGYLSLIEHGGEFYPLRLSRLGKLILTQ